MSEGLKDYFSGGEWKEFISNISKLLNLSICNFVISWNEKIQKALNENPLCLKIREKEEGLKLCNKMYDEHLRKIQDQDYPHIFYCHASLARILIPVNFNQERFVLIMCGIKCKVKAEVDWEILKNIIEKDEFFVLFKKLPYIPYKKIALSTQAIHFLFKNIIELLLIKENLKKLI